MAGTWAAVNDEWHRLLFHYLPIDMVNIPRYFSFSIYIYIFVQFTYFFSNDEYS